MDGDSFNETSKFMLLLILAESVFEVMNSEQIQETLTNVFLKTW